MSRATVERYRIAVDAADTIRETFGNIGDVRRGSRLLDALTDSQCSDRECYVMPAWETIRHADFEPGNTLPEVPRYGDPLPALVELGYVETFDVLSESEDGAYIDDARRVIGVRVLRPFVIQQVTYQYKSVTAGWWNGHSNTGHVTGWTLGHRTGVVAAGVYIIGETGNAYVMRPVCAAYIGPDADTDDLFYAVAADDDFGASHAHAGCSVNADHVWYAESGSWHFTPDDDAAGVAPFDFDDVDDFDTDETFACPVDGCPGRVGIDVH